MPAALNLSNEVVKMRAEVKRVKVLIIRKLTRQIAVLKKKKGTETDLERNQRRAARLLEEIHVLKALAPDSVTKAALQSDISFEKVCQKKESSLSERATARIATHPEFSKRIQSIKNAVEAFKAERLSAEKKEKRSTDEERESGLDSGNEEEEEDDDDDDDDDGSSQEVHKQEEQLKEPTEQNKDPHVEKESHSETGNIPVEVVRMRKEVKKLRVLIIRNLVQQITALKKTKAEESELKGNMECAARLQKEVEVLRTLLPDHVTTRALEGSIDIEKVFQDPESSAVERATARIATHARFVKKLQDVRHALEVEKIKAAKAGEANKNVSEVMKAEHSEGEVEDKEEEEEEEETSDDSDDEDEEEEASDDNDDDEEVASDDGDEEEENVKIKEKNPTLMEMPMSNFGKPPEDTKLASAQEKPKRVELEKASKSPDNLKSSSKTPVKAVQSLPPKSKEAAPTPVRHVSKPDTKKPESRKVAEESDLSDSEEEKEYFDDSTEERFHKQSSYSEQSDDDDFFLGKVSKLKKKKKNDTASRPEKTNDSNKPPEKEVKETPQFKIQSVFCSTLSKSSISSQKGKHGSPKQRPFQNQKHEEKPSWGKNQGSGRERKPAGFKIQAPGSGGGDKTGRPAFDRKNTPINKVGKHSQHALHPSWEASRKRKEQQAQITAFQGKKIKFDDD
ncbi:serum response factor-binding protein 1 [Tachysurus fulvidraco]|uniref:serum response factor-binding protein 1 n=1 Tax=Tachysurus fulvidraco TaxID=1234273 RepID=UPI001FEF4C49|nr:serum response factor-binding protein 1 [Tachysurus fulvidraco]